MKEKSKLIEEMFEKGILISKEFLESEQTEEITKTIEAEEDLLVINSDYADVMKQQSTLVDWYELDKHRVDSEKERNDELYQTELQSIKKTSLSIKPNEKEQEVSSIETELNKDTIESNFSSEDTVPNKEDDGLELTTLMENKKITKVIHESIEILVNYQNKPFKYKVKDFANIFVSRYKFLERILRTRQELNGTTSINRVLDKKEKESVSIIGIVEEVGITKNGHLILTLEDLTGKIKVLVSKNNKDLFEEAKDIIPDEIIGIVGKSADKIIFAEKLAWPDVPGNREMKTSPVEEYAIFLSDLHVGSKLFLVEEFQKFLSWIKGESGTEIQRNIAKKAKYIVIAGDLIDGIGIYPSQESELSITSVEGQYEEFCKLIQQIPKDKQIIICPGNHDMVHLAEPQPIFYKDFSNELHEMENVTLITNPGVIKIGKNKDFSGFEVLMYHGYSFDYYVANVESIRNNGGYHRADLIMKFLLKRRHLAPSFKSTPYFPGHKDDPLLIRTIPDFFITGHIHYSKVANYKGVTMISGSCWQAKTSFQEKLGHEPEPARVPVVNLKTRAVKILKFI
jgi:DNA polymerase II small subunit